MTSSISSEFEPDVPELDWSMMLKIHSGICDKVGVEKRTLTPDEIDSVILRVSGWDVGTDVGAEYLAEAFKQVTDREAHIYKGGGSPAGAKTYKGYIIAPGTTMPSYDIHEYEIFGSFGQYEEHSPVHTAESEAEAEQWVDKQTGPIRSSVYPPRKGVMPKLPEEARGDFLFFEYIRDLCKYRALSEEDAKSLWEGYKQQRRGAR